MLHLAQCQRRARDHANSKQASSPQLAAARSSGGESGGKPRKRTCAHLLRLAHVCCKLVFARDAAEEGQQVSHAVDGVGQPL